MTGNIRTAKKGIWLGLLAAGLLAGLLRAVVYACFYRPFPQDMTCADLPPGSLVLVLGFEYRTLPDGTIDPGEANRFLARRLADCAHRIGGVLTQQAVVAALDQGGWLVDGKLAGRIPVGLMHPHVPGAPVRTLQALQSALEQLDPLPEALVLLAHDKQAGRARADLASLYPGRTILWQINAVPYLDGKWYRPLIWALRELYIAGPFEAAQRWLQ